MENADKALEARINEIEKRLNMFQAMVMREQAQGSLAAAISSQRHLQILISNFIIQIQTLTLYFKYSTSNSNFILYT